MKLKEPLTVEVVYLDYNGIVQQVQAFRLPPDAREWFGTVFTDILLRDAMREVGIPVKKAVSWKEITQS